MQMGPPGGSDAGGPTLFAVGVVVPVFGRLPPRTRLPEEAEGLCIPAWFLKPHHFKGRVKWGNGVLRRSRRGRFTQRGRAVGSIFSGGSPVSPEAHCKVL